MAMTDDEILQAAAKIQSARRRRETKACAVCGTEFEGIARRRYCSAACRVRASRGGLTGAATPRYEQAPLEPRRPDESIMAYLDRFDAYLTGGAVPASDSGEYEGPAPKQGSLALSHRNGALGGELLTAEARDREEETLIERFAWIRNSSKFDPDPDWDTVEEIRIMREERDAALDRATGRTVEEQAPPAPRGEDEPLLDYLERVSTYIMGDRIFEDDSAKLVRQSRRERVAQLVTAIESGPVEL